MRKDIKILRYLNLVAAFILISSLAYYLLYFFSPYNDKVLPHYSHRDFIFCTLSISIIAVAGLGLIIKKSFGLSLPKGKDGKLLMKETVDLKPKLIEGQTAIWWNLGYIFISILLIAMSLGDAIDTIRFLILGS